MKKLYVVILLFLSFCFNSFSAEKADNNWKRHFFDISLLGGFSASNYGHIGGNFGTSVGYQYRFTKYFAFGPGATLIGSVTYNPNYNPQHPTMFGSMDFGNNGGAVMGLFMFGDMDNKKIAFLFDIGAGWLFATKIGCYINGFVFKLGYHSTFSFYYHNIILEFGYKFNWGSKK